ncbi:Cna B-type domain-containing protein [Gracilibacillus timonensis]|uniref:Cna B-type domain-containing protein n=1 Tax=Gracilibacillus timonensis TaxID=1816696 RepID=UPI000826E762|nr:Cna B-type domain-containing protein [Gracilibacillus timonensis]
MKKYLSLWLIFLLLIQTAASGMLPAQLVQAQESQNSIFQEPAVVETSDGRELHIDWSLADQEIIPGDLIALESPIALEVEDGNLTAEETEIADYSVDGQSISVTFSEAALDYPEAEGTLVLTVDEPEAVEETNAEAEEAVEEQDPAAEEEDEVTGQEESGFEEETPVSEAEGTEENVEEEGVEEQESSETEKTEQEVTGEEANNENKEAEETTKSEFEEVEADVDQTEDIPDIGTSSIQPLRALGNIFTFESLTIDNGVVGDGDIIEIADGTIADLRFSWHTQGLNAQAGDTAEIELSDAFKMVTTPTQDLIVDGTNVGTYHVENGVLKFEFNEGIETSDVQNGFVNLGLEFNMEKFRENIEQEIPFNDGHENNITVIAKPNIDHSGIDKEGHPDTEHDAREVTWTIDVINTNDEEITDATLADNIPDGLGEARDFVIHELSVGYDGDIREGDDVTSTLNPSAFPIDLGNVAPFNGYRVQYTTTIENYAAESFTNEATFEYGEESLPADATIDGLTRSNPIEKDGWQVEDSDVIQWQIDVNKNGSIIREAIVEDSLPEGLTVDPNSIEVVRITQNGDTWSEGDPHENLFTEFPINLGALGQDDTYRIKFKSNVNWSEVNDSDYQRENGFQNEVTLKDGEDELNNDDATVNIVRDPVLRKVGASNVDYDNKTVTWTIHVNEAGHSIGNVVLTDLIPGGLAITADDIVIRDENEAIYIPNDIEINPDADGGTAVEINLGNVGTKHLKIEYTTAITDFTINNFNNSVGMIGDGIGEDGENSNAEIRPEGNTYDKSFAGIAYNQKTMDWQLTVNPRREAIDSLVIEDTFPNRGMILLPGSVEVQHAGESLVEGTDYTLVPRTEDGETGYHKGFTIEFLANALPLDGGQLVVNYTTSYDPQRVVDGNTLDPHVRDGEQDRVYHNRVNFNGDTENDNPIDETRSADTTVRVDSWNSGKKEGQLISVDSEGNIVEENDWVSGNERRIAWQLYTNYQQQDLGENVSITDTLGYTGEIDADRIRISVYDVDANGETTITDNVLSPSEYSVVVNGNEFTITFNNEVTERYVIEFTTSVPDISESNYINNAIVEVEGEPYHYEATINYNEHNDFLKKSTIGLDGNQVFTGDEVEWEATVNESLSIIQNAVITDTISAGHVYKEDSLEIFRSHDQENALEEGIDYDLEVVAITDENDELTGETNLVIDMTEDLKDTLVLRYTTVVTETDGNIGNKISLDGTSIERQEQESNQLNARQFSDAGGEWAANRGALSVAKIDAETEETITNEATFTLWYELNGERVQYTQEEAFTTVDGVLEIGNLPLRTYYLVEEDAPAGYVLSEDEIEFVVDTAYNNNEENIVSNTFENTKEKINVTGTKEWQGGENQRPESIELQLYRDGEALGDPVTLEDSETEYTWYDLDRTDIDGNAYEYIVDEVNVPDNYEKSVSDDGLTITNEYVSPTTDISVEKSWVDAEDQDGNRPESVEVALFANGEETDKENITLSNDNEWQASFTELPEFDNSGSAIIYTVEEVNVPEEYESDVTGDATDGFVITNSYTPGKVDIPVEKVWDDANNQDGNRPDGIRVNLLADGEETSRNIILNESNNWEASFTDLDEYQDGEQIEYTVAESNVPDEYESAVGGNAEDGYTITNSYTPEVTDITVEKAWDDANNQDGERPDSITIHLYDNDHSEFVASEEITADEDGNWSHVFENLPKYRDGVEIAYSIAEDTVEDYSTSISNNSDGTFTVTNEHTPEQTSVTVNKLWDDANNQDGERPDSIRVQLLADGEPLGNTVLVTAGDNWSYTWSGLDANRDGGETIEYTVKEVDVPTGYESEINDENHGAITITNNYEPELINIPVEKEWDDANNQDGNRPDSITLNVVNGASEIVKTAEVTPDEDGNWSHVFEDLPKYQDGNEIEYRVTEDAIEGYSVTTEKQADGFVIINSYTPEQKSLTVVKGWEDGDNQDGVRPDNVTVQLFADEEPAGNPVRLSQENDWTHTWTELNVNQNGEPIHYTVEETEIPEGYEEPTVTEQNGNVLITNNRTLDTVDIPVTKEWNDAEDQDGVRPDNVTVQVINDRSEVVDTVELNEENNWTHTFENLPKNRNQGEEIGYRVTEDTVEGYSTEIEISEDDERIITNAYTPEQTSVTVTKGWQDNDNQDGLRSEQVEVQLYAGEDAIGDTVALSAENDWMHTWSGLDTYQNGGEEIDYTVQEVSIPDGYEVSVNDEDHGNIILTNHHTPEQTSINISKTWNDANNQDGIRPDSITVNLFADDEKIASIELNESNNWQANITELDKFKKGELIDYTVEELTVDGYESETTGNAADGYIITNIHEPELIDLAGTKEWNDGNNHHDQRPDSITVNLLANGEKVDSVEVTSETDWTFVFTNQPKFENGEGINYTVVEEKVDGYVSSVDVKDLNNVVIVNRPEKVSVGDYVWFDENRDGLQDDTDIPVEGVVLTLEDEDGNLVTDVYGDPVEPTTTDDEGWYTFDNLPIDHTYTVRIDREASEDALRGYEPTLHEEGDDNAVDSSTWEATSRHLTEDEERDPTLDFGFVKSKRVSVGDYVWYDENRDGLQDDTDIPVEGVVLTIEDEDGNPVTDVYGELVGPTTTDENGWYTFDDLPADHTYTVHIDREKSADVLQDYEPTLDEEGDDNAVDSSTWEATSRHLTEDEERDPTLDFGFVRVVTDLSGTKTWNDADNQDGKRPDSIMVHLLANGKEVDSVEVTAETDWTFAFINQPKLENGEEINYTVQEDNVEGYSAAMDGMNITNSYTPEQTSINVVKHWNDGNYKEVRPKAITINLLADGEKVDSRELNKSNNWQADFTGLDLFADGEEIDYTVEEEEVTGYVSSVEVKDSSNVIIVNSPKKVSVGDYVWYDENKNGLQDETDIPIEGVVLTIEDEDGNPVTDVYGNLVGPTTTDEDGWYTFNDLPIDNTYIVRIDREASAKALEGYVPTLEGVGDDITIDSSTWFATSRHLTEDEERDPTLDFGFVKEELGEPESPDPADPAKPADPGDPEEPTKPEDPETTDPGEGDTESTTDQPGSDETGDGELPATATNTFNLLLIGLALTILGGASILIAKRRKES